MLWEKKNLDVVIFLLLQLSYSRNRMKKKLKLLTMQKII